MRDDVALRRRLSMAGRIHKMTPAERQLSSHTYSNCGIIYDLHGLGTALTALTAVRNDFFKSSLLSFLNTFVIRLCNVHAWQDLVIDVLWAVSISVNNDSELIRRLNQRWPIPQGHISIPKHTFLWSVHPKLQRRQVTGLNLLPYCGKVAISQICKHTRSRSNNDHLKSNIWIKNEEII